MSDAPHVPARRGFLGRRGWVWTLIAGWFVPAIMTCAYVALALLAETDAIDSAWMGIGLLFVLCLWWMLRTLTQTAALSRAVGVGDADTILEIATHALAGWFVIGRTDLIIYMAIAFELRGDWARALAAVDKAGVEPTSSRKRRVLAASVKITALVETGELAKARAVLDGELAPVAAILNARLDAQLVILARLARGRVLVAERDPEAIAVLDQVIDDVRTGDATRALARGLRDRAAQNRQAAATPA